MISEHRL